MNHIETWFLILALFLPRLALLIAYFTQNIPLNPVPFWGDVVAAIFLPRFLITFYVFVNYGYENVWFWVHGVLAIAMLFSRVTVNSSRE